MQIIQHPISKMEPLCQIQLYKIFGEEHFQIELEQDSDKVDWSAFYTQLTPGHSLRYLTKKWDDGATHACLLSLTPTNSALKLLTVTHPSLSSPTIPGEVKANTIKTHLQKTYPQCSGINSQKLMQGLGRRGILLECIDCEESQIVIPHLLLSRDNFEWGQLSYFLRSSDGMLRTLAWRSPREQEWRKIKGQAQFQPYLLLQDVSFSHILSTSALLPK